MAGRLRRDDGRYWEGPTEIVAVANLPAGAKGLGVMSMGEDGKEGTEDDLKSWDLKSD